MAEQKQDLQEEKKPEAEGEALSRKRRVALVTYLSILFAVAFLLVALSMVIENKHLQSTNAALEDSSKKTSANLNQTIEQMQNENDALTQKTAEQESHFLLMTIKLTGFTVTPGMAVLHRNLIFM